MAAAVLFLAALLPSPVAADPDVDCLQFGLTTGCTTRQFQEGDGTVSIPIYLEVSEAWTLDPNWSTGRSQLVIR